MKPNYAPFNRNELIMLKCTKMLMLFCFKRKMGGRVERLSDDRRAGVGRAEAVLL